MITIINKHGIYAPFVLCDVCGKEITKRDGMVKFSWEAKDPPLFCHKDGCDREQDDEKRPLWNDLDAVLVWLLENTNIEWKDAKRRADFLAAIR